MDLIFHILIFELIKDKFWEFEDLFEKLMVDLTTISESEFLKKYPNKVILLKNKKLNQIKIHFKKMDGVYVITHIE